MSTQDVASENARVAVEVEALRLKTLRLLYERMLVVAATSTDLKQLAEALSLTSWAGQPGRPERPGP